MRLLVTGSRTWTDAPFIRRELHSVLCPEFGVFRPLTLVHGGAIRGADCIADEWAEMEIADHDSPITVECHAADWKQHGKRAGLIRNAEMVKAGADLCLAFIRAHSRGATHCAALASAAGIETRIYRWEDL